MLPPQEAAQAAADLGATLTDAAAYEAHRIALGVPSGGRDFQYGDTFPHEADMDQLAGVDFEKGCYVGQEVVSRVEHRNSARSRLVPVTYDGGAPDDGAPVTAGDKQVGTLGSTADGHGIALAAPRPRRRRARRRPAAHGRRGCDPRGEAGLGDVRVAGRRTSGGVSVGLPRQFGTQPLYLRGHGKARPDSP